MAETVNVAAFGVLTEGSVTPGVNVAAFGVLLELVPAPPLSSPLVVAGHATASLGGFDLTAYLNQAGFSIALNTIDGTHEDSDASEAVPGLPTYTVSMGGLWALALDAVLGIGATVQPFVLVVGDAPEIVTYTWAAAYVSEYSVAAGGGAAAMLWTAAVQCSGTPVRWMGL